MNEHEQYIIDKYAKQYDELVKIRNYLNEQLSQWNEKLIESKDQIRKTIQIDVEKQIQAIQSKEKLSKKI